MKLRSSRIITVPSYKTPVQPVQSVQAIQPVQPIQPVGQKTFFIGSFIFIIGLFIYYCTPPEPEPPVKMDWSKIFADSY